MPSVNDVYPSKYLVAADLRGRAHTYTVEHVAVGEVGQGAEAKTQLMVSFHEVEKQLGLNKTNAAAIAGLYGDDTDDWIGESVVLFPTRVDFSGKMVDAIRVDEKATRGLIQAKLMAAKAAKKAAPAPASRPRSQTQAEIDAEIGPDPSEDIEIDSIPF